MVRFQKLKVALATVLGVLVAFSGSTSLAAVIATFGEDSGGDRRDVLRCSDDELIVGLRIRHGAYVDGIQLICGSITDLSRQRNGPGLFGKNPVAALPGIRSRETIRRCNAGHYITALIANSGDFVDGISSITCRNRSTGTVQRFSLSGVGGTGGDTELASCRSGEHLSALELKVGAWLNFMAVNCSATPSLSRGNQKQLSALKGSALKRQQPKPVQKRPIVPKLKSLNALERSRLQSVARPKMTRIERAKTKADRAQEERMRKTAAKILKIRDDAARRNAIAQFNRRYSKAQSAFSKRAGVRPNAILRESQRLFGNRNMKKDRGGRYQFLNGQAPRTAGKRTGVDSGDPASRNYFDVRYASSNCQRAVDLDIDDGAPGTVEAEQHNGIGSLCHSDTALGTIVSVPAGVDRVHVQFELEEAVIRAVSGMLFGYSQAWADLGIRVTGPDNFERYFVNDSVLALTLVAGLAEEIKRFDGRHLVDASFEPRPSGGDYQVQVYGGLFSLGAGVGGARAEFEAEVHRLEVEYD